MLLPFIDILGPTKRVATRVVPLWSVRLKCAELAIYVADADIEVEIDLAFIDFDLSVGNKVDVEFS